MTRAGALALSALVWGWGCASGSGAPPVPGFERGGMPELAGARVVVLPVQNADQGHPELDAELAFALAESGADVSWVFPADIRSMIERNPGVTLRIDALPVGNFLVAEVERIGDPLFGDLYRLGALANATYGLLPVEARRSPRGQGASLEISAALVELRGGRVLWFGVVEGAEGAVGDMSVSASAAEALARRVVR